MSWSLQDAKNKFSQVVAEALAGKPQRVTRHGKDAVVVLSAVDYDRLTFAQSNEAPTFVDFILQIPQGEEIKREPIIPRELDR